MGGGIEASIWEEKETKFPASFQKRGRNRSDLIEVVRAVVEGSFERRAERKGRSLLSGKVEFTAVRSIQSNLCYSKGREKERRGRELKIRNIGGQMSILHDRWIDSHDSRLS